MKSLALLVKEIIETGLSQEGKGKGKRSGSHDVQHPGIKSASNVLRGLSSANCKIEYYLSAYEKIYATHKKQLFNSASNPGWMTEIVVKAELGDSRNGVCLNLSMAMNSAIKMRKAIEDKKYANPNDRDEAYGNYKYSYVDLLYYKLIIVIIDALPEGNSDIKKLTKLADEFKSRTYLNSSSTSEDESDDSKPSLGKTVSEISGDKISSKALENMIGTFANNASALEKVKDVVANIKPGDGNPLENTELLTSTVTSIAPIFSNIINDMAKAQKKASESSSESSGTEESQSDD